MNLRTSSRGWTVLFCLWALQGIVAFAVLVALPSDPETGILFGLSAARLMLVVADVILTLAAGWLTWSTFRPSWSDFVNRPALWDAALIAGLLTIFLSLSTLAILHGLSQGGLVYRYSAYASRLAPLLNLLTVSALELVFWIIWLRREWLKRTQPAILITLWVWLCLGMILAEVAVTRFGVQPELIGVWSKPTTPFWEWQILLAWGIGSILLLFKSFGKFPRIPHPDLWIGFTIWLGVFALWISQPINLAQQFGPRAPNFEFYPFSDALVYDQYAQSILIGNGIFEHAIPARPLYVGFLALLHALVGQDYNRVIALQSLVLALFPLTLYFIGKEISGRPLGIMLAILTASRDVMTNLSASYAGNFSYSKFYLSELPTALLLSLFTLFLLRGAKRPSLWNANFMLAGGMLGLATLMRTQSLLILPPALLLAYFGNRSNWRDWFRAVVTLTITLMLAITPWIWRNWLITGGIIFEDPNSQMALRALWYHRMGDAVVERLPNENDSEFSKRLVSIALAGIREYPRDNARLILAHFLNNEIGNVLLFPVRDGLQGLMELLRPTRAFWEEVDLDFSSGQSALLAFYLLIFSCGIAAAWRTSGLAGLTPLAVNLSYNFSTAMFLSSGMRFLLTADWGFYFYYALGILALTRGILQLLQVTHERMIREKNTPASDLQNSKNYSWKPVLLGGLALLLVSSSLPLSERLVPKRYQPASQAALIKQIATATPESMKGELTQMLQEPDIVVLQGRALYPRFYEAGEGESGTAKLGYGPMPQARLVFFMVGDQNTLVIFDLQQPPGFFPHAADVVLIAQKSSNHLKALSVLVKNEADSEIYFGSGK